MVSPRSSKAKAAFVAVSTTHLHYNMGAIVAVVPTRVMNECGLDLERWRADRQAAEARLEADGKLAERLGVRAIPTWFLGGYRLRGDQSLRLDLADKLAVYFGITVAEPSPKRTSRPGRKK